MSENNDKSFIKTLKKLLTQQNERIDALESKNKGVLNCLEEIVNSMKNFDAINNIQKILKKLKMDRKL